jgi:hypothetical protein
MIAMTTSNPSTTTVRFIEILTNDDSAVRLTFVGIIVAEVFIVKHILV